MSYYELLSITETGRAVTGQYEGLVDWWTRLHLVSARRGGGFLD